VDEVGWRRVISGKLRIAFDTHRAAPGPVGISYFEQKIVEQPTICSRLKLDLREDCACRAKGTSARQHLREIIPCDFVLMIEPAAAG
jgi:hypothetical protein